MTSTKAAASAERVLDILEAFEIARRPLSLTELAEVTGIPKSSCHRIVASLIGRGYLYSLTTDRRLYPTRRAFDVASEVLRHDPFYSQFAPVLERLRDACWETVLLGKRQGDAVVYLQVFEGKHALRYVPQPGDFRPLAVTATGRALVGALREREIRAWCAQHAEAGADNGSLLEDILRGRRLGYFVATGINGIDAASVATSVHLGGETFSVGAAGLRSRVEANYDELAKAVTATCAALSQRIAGTAAARV